MRDFYTFSPKQLTALTWWCKGSLWEQKDALICDGAVRSGKTLCMSLSFILWSFYQFEDMAFALCGKTISALRRNVVMPLCPILEGLGFVCQEKVSQNLLEITLGGRKNSFYLFSGKDESSAALIQGMTLGGVMFDEVALMPRSFVEQALARCSVEGSRFWFNCNPENPFHWFYQEWIQHKDQKNALYLHFSMEDNPSLSSEMIARYHSLYTGRFYERFVQGKWVAAEGLVYPMFDPKLHVVAKQPECQKFWVSCDYGTVNPASFGLWGESEGRWIRLKEYYYDARAERKLRTDEEHYAQLQKLIGGRTVEGVIVDPSAASFLECIRRHGEFRAVPAKNDVPAGIQKVSERLQKGTLLFHEGCQDTLREFSLYRWDERAQKDIPLKQNDHAMDDLRYFVMTALEQAPKRDFVALVSSRRKI